MVNQRSVIGKKKLDPCLSYFLSKVLVEGCSIYSPIYMDAFASDARFSQVRPFLPRDSVLQHILEWLGGLCDP